MALSIAKGALVVVAGLAVVLGLLWATGILTPLRAVNLLTSRAGYVLEADVAYGALPRQRLDVFRAAPDTGPVVVFIHGGAWQSGVKDEYRFVGQAFAAAGYTTVVPNYRLYPEAVFPAFAEDAAAALAWTAANLTDPEGRPRPIALIGHSAGAHIALLIGLDERFLARVPAGALAGLVGISGPYDFLPLQEEIYRRIFPEPVREASQPIAFVDGTEPPVLLLSGDADQTVDPANATRLAARIAEKGGQVAVRLYPGVGHIGTLAALAGAIPGPKPPVLDDILAFIAGIGS